MLRKLFSSTYKNTDLDTENNQYKYHEKLVLQRKRRWRATQGIVCYQDKPTGVKVRTPETMPKGQSLTREPARAKWCSGLTPIQKTSTPSQASGSLASAATILWVQTNDHIGGVTGHQTDFPTHHKDKSCMLGFSSSLPSFCNGSVTPASPRLCPAGVGTQKKPLGFSLGLDPRGLLTIEGNFVQAENQKGASGEAAQVDPRCRQMTSWGSPLVMGPMPWGNQGKSSGHRAYLFFLKYTAALLFGEPWHPI